MGVLHLCLHLFLSLMSGLHVLLGLISITRFPQLEHAWRSNKEGATSDKRCHRDGALRCIRYSPGRVVFQNVLHAKLVLE